MRSAIKTRQRRSQRPLQGGRSPAADSGGATAARPRSDALAAALAVLLALAGRPAQAATGSAATPRPAVSQAWLHTVAADIHGAQYRVALSPAGGFRAANPAHELDAAWDAGRMQVRPAGDVVPWVFRSELLGVGREGAPRPAVAPAACARIEEDGRLDWTRDGLREWYVNDARGIEQWLEIERRPEGPEGSPLVIEERMSGLVPHAAEDGHSILLGTPDGRDALRLSGLHVVDAAGRVLPSRFAVAGPDLVRLLIDDRDARYPVTVDPLMTSASWSAEADQSGAELGFSLASAGDVNGDGFDDVIVGAARYNNPGNNGGRVLVYHGSASGLATSASSIVEADQNAAWFGRSVASAGDVNGDGFDDVVIGTMFYSNGESQEGKASVYLGSASGLGASPAWTVEGNQADANFGEFVASAGDVNGDGFDDVIVGSRWYDDGETDEGRALVYLGSAAGLQTSPAWSAQGDQTSAHYATSVASAGDVNGDGFDDVIVGAPHYGNGQDGEGRAFLYLGSAAGLAASAAWTAESDQFFAGFGTSVASAGDVNGDGFDDVIIGCPQASNGQSQEGRAFLYLGSATGLAASAAWTGESNQASADFGRAVASAGDVNADGYDDVLVGARFYDNGESNEGRAFVYHGSASGPSASPDWTAESDQADAWLGASVAPAGDVNGDGFADVLVGAYQYDGGQSDEGKAFLYEWLNHAPASLPGGPYAVACQGGGASLALDGGASYDADGNAITFSWTTDCTGASLTGAATATPTLTLPSTLGCGTLCTVRLAVSDGHASTSATASITVTPSGSVDALQPVRSSTRVTLANTATVQALVSFLNPTSCPIQVTAVSVAGDFSNPALALASSAPAVPFTVCPGATIDIPVDVTASGALGGTYQGVVKLAGASGGITAGLEVIVTGVARSDIAVATPAVTGDLSGAPPLLDASQGFTVSAQVANRGNAAATGFTVAYLAVIDGQEVLLGSSAVSALAVGATIAIQAHVAGGTLPAGFHVIRVQLAQPPAEGNLLTTNDSAATVLQLGTPPVSGAALVVSAGADQGCVGAVINVSGRADYYLVSDTGSLLDFPVQGGRVTVTLLDASSHVVSVTSTVHTLTTGSFLQPVAAPPTGGYTVRVDVTDFSLDGGTDTALTVLSAFQCAPPVTAPPPPVPPPLNIDLWVCGDDIRFFETAGGACTSTPLTTAVAGVPVCVRADVSYYANLGGQAAPQLFMQPIAARVHVHNPTSGELDTVAVHEGALSFTGAGSLPVEFIWTPALDGEHVVEIAWEPTIDQYRGNDRATRALVVGSGVPRTDVDVAVEIGNACGTLELAGRADYRSGSGERVAVGCGQVTVRVRDGSGDEVASGGETRTLADGSYRTSLSFSTPPGSYTVEVTVTDGVLSGTGSAAFSCVPPPPSDPVAPAPPPTQGFYGDVFLYAEDVSFLGDGGCSTGLLRNPEPGETVGVHATAHYVQSGPANPHTVTLTAVEHIPVGDELVAVTVGSAGPLALPATGGTVEACIPWTPTSAGTRIMQVLLEPDFSQYELNDAATRAITAGSTVCRLAAGTRTVELVSGGSATLSVSAAHSGSATPSLALSLKPLPPATALPPGLGAEFSPAGSLASPFTSTLTLTTTRSLLPGRYPLAILGRGDVCNALASFTLVVSSANVAPVADAGTDQSADEGDSITLDGSASRDDDGDPLSFFWSQVAGTTATLDTSDPVRPRFVAPLVPAGGETLTFRLVVHDGYRSSEADFVNVTVKDVNHAPVVDAGDDQTVEEGSPVALSGAHSYDPDGDPLTYQWTQTGGTAVTLSDPAAVAPTLTSPQVGPAGETLVFLLTVGDGPLSGQDSVAVVIANVNQPPVAAAGADLTVNESTPVALDGGGSSDPDGDALSFSWSQVGGPAVSLAGAATATPSFTAPAVDPGGADLTFRLVVGDGFLQSPADDVTVHVQNANDPPVCTLARPSIASLWPPDHKLVAVTIQGVSDPQNDPVAITVLSVTQDEPLNGLGDGDTAPDAVVQGSTVLLRAERSGKGDGRVYRIQFQADDGNGGRCTGSGLAVQVPHDRAGTAVDSGQTVNSLGQ